MINGNRLEWETKHPQSGAPMRLTVPLDVVAVFLSESRTLERFRMMVLEWNWKERERERIEAISTAALRQQERARAAKAGGI